MDDYSMSSLQESRNEWCARLINILTPLIIEGVKSIFDESWKLCQDNDEVDKYLMTFQNFLARIPKWNPTIVDEETNRILDKSKCGYLNDLISCVHVIQLKSLTCMRVGNKQKKIDITIPSLNDFIHKVYINSARKIYTNIYLFEKNISPLQIQKHNRELELIIKEQILNTIRENIPVEHILKVYLDETIEDDVQVEEKEEIISSEPIKNETTETTDLEDNAEDDTNIHENIDISENKDNREAPHTLNIINKKESVQFNGKDETISIDNIISNLESPNTTESLVEQLNNKIIDNKPQIYTNNDDKLTIGERINLTDLDVHDLEKPNILHKNHVGIGDIEILT